MTQMLPPQARAIVFANKTYNKIFGIGYNKTGTTSLEAMLKYYGFRMPNQQEQEIRTTFPTFRCDYAELKQIVHQYDAFQDLPFSSGETYAVLDALFPNSKFILTERDPDAWFNSLTKFHEKVFNLSSISEVDESILLTKFTYLFPGYSHALTKHMLTRFVEDQAEVEWEKLYDRDYYIQEYLARNNRIKKFFQNCPGRLLVLDLTREINSAKLCSFLNIPQDFVVTIPHRNQT